MKACECNSFGLCNSSHRRLAAHILTRIFLRKSQGSIARRYSRFKLRLEVEA